jgi:hypothetical protein
MNGDHTGPAFAPTATRTLIAPRSRERQVTTRATVPPIEGHGANKTTARRPDQAIQSGL